MAQAGKIYFMNRLNKTTFKIISLLLLTLFSGDALAIWDVVQQLGAETHFLSDEGITAIRLHDSDDSEDNGQQVDTCPLCPCCTSGVHMSLSDFAIRNEKMLLGILAFESKPTKGFSEDFVFHPPRFLS